ncbi:hypothetical protein NBRC116592_24360 [Colwellia sp. KU-HH00111]|uniref:hypothetical protein n=1 Tax=Colwellia sp. KU-HH00111 TaxID=3127652 RepID=UPI00310BEF33
MTLKRYLYSSTLISTLLLTACGGSSDNSSIPSVEPSAQDAILQLESNLMINQGVDLVLYYPDDELGNIHWQQTAGASVALLADTSKVVGFTPTSAGDYSFEVSFNKNGGALQTITKSITVSEESSPITARLAHEVASENKVSLRAQLGINTDNSSVKWQQVAGPSVGLSTSTTQGELAIFFDAPKVTKDTYLSFAASVTSQGTQYTDTVTVLVEPADNINSNAYFDTRVAEVFAYNENSPYKATLTDCVYSNSLTSSCTLSKLPLIASEVQNSNSTPSINTIMDRVVVSHQWMGDRFKAFLENNDPHDDIKNLLRATTAIVISYDVRPSFYWAATGAIYLDADNFWLTAQERDTINEAPDFRADFGNDLQFVMPWRYVKENAYASAYIPSHIRSDRAASAGLYRLTSLMYHELAHANDFFPSTEWYSHSAQTRILDAALSTDFESDQLSVAMPLTSQIMRDLAQVSFAGVDANSTQKSYLPADVETFFSADSATDFYAYSSLREDYAMLFEELMMQKRFNIFRDVAITNQPTGSNVTGQDYIVTWGQRGRIGDTKIKPRVLFSAKRVLPEFDSESALAAVADPINMIIGENWVNNLTISPAPTSGYKLNKTEHVIPQQVQPRFNQYYQKALPKH